MHDLGTLITVAPTGGSANKDDVPTLPTTIEEVVQTVVACEAAGAGIVHLHVRDEQTAKPTLDPGRVKEMIAAIRESTDLLVEISTGGALTDTPEDRKRMLSVGADIATVACGSVNIGDGVFLNSWPFLSGLYQEILDAGAIPTFELLDYGHIITMKRLLDLYGPPKGGHVHCELIMGLVGGMPATHDAVNAVLGELPAEATFAISGVETSAVPMSLTAISLGGHIRTGMEDVVAMVDGKRLDNLELVTRTARMAEAAGRPPMAAKEARRMLGMESAGV